MEKMKKQRKNAFMMIQRFFILYPEAPENKKEIANSTFNLLALVCDIELHNIHSKIVKYFLGIHPVLL